jgi:hypothetical protein
VGNFCSASSAPHPGLSRTVIGAWLRDHEAGTGRESYIWGLGFPQQDTWKGVVIVQQTLKRLTISCLGP